MTEQEAVYEELKRRGYPEATAAILATDGHHSLAYSFALVAVRWKALMRDVLEVCRKASDTPIFRRRR
jgi:hypothetical protein